MFIILEVTEKALTELTERATANCYSTEKMIARMLKFPVVSVKIERVKKQAKA